MFIAIQTWQVILEDGRVMRVPETNLDHFLKVLTFNRLEFDVRCEPPPFEQIVSPGVEEGDTEA